MNGRGKGDGRVVRCVREGSSGDLQVNRVVLDHVADPEAILHDGTESKEIE